MAKLHPTLWRTCRILSGKTRLALLRQVIDFPEQPVSVLARNLDLSLPRASQELRRLQSRGLIQAGHHGKNVLYRPVPDPLVSTAAPLLQAMRETFRLHPAGEDDQAIRIAIGFSHVRRLVILRLLLIGPMDMSTLEELAGMSRDALNRHVLKLQAAGLIQRQDHMIRLQPAGHPLAESLLRILGGNRKSPPVASA